METKKQRTEKEIAAFEGRFAGAFVAKTATGYTAWIDGAAVASVRIHNSPERTFRALASRMPVQA